MVDQASPAFDVSLDDKYDLAKRRVFLNGTQAVARLLLMQKRRDELAGLNTGGFVSGYRGSPLGGLDLQLQRAGKKLKPAGILFQPGLNEDLAATAVWGTQQAEMRGEGTKDGVFALWYGKGPGVDRSGDVFRHANMAGTSKHGGVIALMGDDHMAESSTNAHQTEFVFVDRMMPVLNPAGVQEILDFGVHAFALSRFAGVWVGLKCVKDNVESTSSVDGSLDRVKVVVPPFDMPPGGLNIRTPDDFLDQEKRLHVHKRAAILAYVKANRINEIVTSGGSRPRIGVITTGKSYLDVRQAMEELGVDEVKANALGLRVFKIGCPWPIGRDELEDFARGLDLIMVVEEKRSLIEVQVREELYGSAHQPVVVGKKDERGEWLFPVHGALDPNDIAIALGERLLARTPDADLSARLAAVRAVQGRIGEVEEHARRVPHYCSGCPHNTSTVVPEGMRAYAGIGCHYMVQWMDRNTDGFTQMGGEGANWIGEAPFSHRQHVFQNLGDGTYTHSGSLAIRWAVAAGVNVTYKLLYNDAVAMTGGQQAEGSLKPWQMASQIAAEGVTRIAVVSDDPDRYPAGIQWPAGATFHHRDDLEGVQRELAAVPGVSLLLYDQTCATEKRRRRKRGDYPDPDRRVIINELVCEGCGDCGVKSNCVSIQPLDTEFGRKRQIDQSNCNKDFSCVKGFCPSFVTVEGARPRKAELPKADAGGVGFGGLGAGELPEPAVPALDRNYGIIVTGVGGTGVVTIGAILGMAAHLEGKGCGMIDMAGLAQKGGAVFSHVRLAPSPDDIHAIRVAAGQADLVLGCDLVVTGSKKVLAAVRKDDTAVICNTAEVMPGNFTRSADFSLPGERIRRAIVAANGRDNTHMIDATAAAVALLGNAIAANMFMMGFAWQLGRIPLSRAALERAIDLNGEAVRMNLDAFALGRRAAHDPVALAAFLGQAKAPTPARHLSESLDEMIERRVRFLTAYQDEAWAGRYARLVEAARAAEATAKPGSTAFVEAVVRYGFKLMAYKDEYEVARLYSDGSFERQVGATFQGERMRYTFHLAPPLLAKVDPVTGEPRKMTFGPWMLHVFRVLAKLKGLRGGRFDIFGYTHERRTERRLIEDYHALVGEIAGALTAANLPLAVALASIPERIRGFGHVKERHLKQAKAEEADLLARFRAGEPAPPMARAAE